MGENLTTLPPWGLINFTGFDAGSELFLRKENGTKDLPAVLQV